MSRANRRPRWVAGRKVLQTAGRQFQAQFEVLEQRNLLTAVVGRYVFYNQSAFDGNSAAIDPISDSAAIATDKTPYIPNGTTATFDNVTSYSRGINGIMVDLDAGGNHAAISASDFVFKVGNNNAPATWAAAPAPSALTVVVGGGVDGSDRVIITWANGSIRNTWLEVQVKSNGNTGLLANDRFFWGNKVGDSGTSSPATTFVTSTTDSLQVFATLGGGKPITDLRDYNRDGSVSTTDALQVFANLGSITRINIAAPPVVGLTTLVTFGDDLTPHVTITASSTLGLADGTLVYLDVDINNDGDFDDPGEFARTTAKLYQGGAYFELTPALPATNPIDGPYIVQLRARVIDAAGNEGTSPLSSMKIDTLGSTALYDYVNAFDPSYSVSASPVSTIAGGEYTVYVFDLKSQSWRSTADLTTPLWQHWLQIIVPTTVTKSTALLWINSGSTSASPPTSLNSDMAALGSLAVAQGMIAVNLPNVPNQPQHFADDPPGFNRAEDQLIAYTFDKFVDNFGAPGNETWLALLPMVKSAVKAMDAVQARDTTLPGAVNVTDFIVTGGSKRGWATWLTGAVDSRVRAIVPRVIDLLNFDESMLHHYGFYGFFSQWIQDYQDYNLIENSMMPAHQEIRRIVDPYAYLFNSNLTNIPKLLLNSTGDEFFVPDSSQLYYSDIPGPKYLRYMPNTGHGLNGTEVIKSTLTFTNAVLNSLPLPQYSWTIEQDGSIRVQTSSAPTSVLLWQATNTSARDFRRTLYPGINWTSSPLGNQGGGVYVGNVATPTTGATAFMIELTFTSPIAGNPYKFTTDVRVASHLPLAPWPYFMPSNEAPLAGALSIADGAESQAIRAIDSKLALAFGLSVMAEPPDSSIGNVPMVVAIPSSPPVAKQSYVRAVDALFDDWSWVGEDLDIGVDQDSDNDRHDPSLKVNSRGRFALN